MRLSRSARVALLLTAGYAGLLLLSVVWGTASIPPAHAFKVLITEMGWGENHSVPELQRFLILQVRLPQGLLLGLVGAALACSGAALQATFENPLADPGILGVSGGASLGAVLAIHSGLADSLFLALPLCACLGGFLASLLVYALTYLGGRPSGPTLLLTGVAVGSMSVAGVSLVMVVTEVHRVQELLFWLVGGVRNQTWDHLALAGPPIAFGVGGLLLLHRRLDALQLGEEQALAIGIPVVWTRLWILVLTALATGAATAVSGGIGFVGLMVPQILRRLVGSRSQPLLVCCITGGAAFLLACELISRSLTERFSLHLGILTSLLGGPTFLLVLRKTRERRS